MGGAGVLRIGNDNGIGRYTFVGSRSYNEIDNV